LYLSALPRDRPATGIFPVEDKEWPITRPMIEWRSEDVKGEQRERERLE
jgi:hypothetical protein